MARVLAYLRVSSDEQAQSGLGMAAQLDAVTRRFGVPDAVYRDDGASGGTLERPGLSALLTCLKKGDVVAVARLDRLSRGDMLAAAWLEREICQKRGGSIRSAAGEGTDDESPQGELLRSIVQAFARFELSSIRARTSAAVKVRMERKRASGEKTGGKHSPYGYGVVLDEQGVKRLVPDAQEQYHIESILRFRGAGMSYQAIADALVQQGVATREGGRWSAKVIRSIVKRQSTSGNSYNIKEAVTA